jgi:hypothetical protein
MHSESIIQADMVMRERCILLQIMNQQGNKIWTGSLAGDKDSKDSERPAETTNNM